MLLSDTRASIGRQLEQRRIFLNKITCYLGNKWNYIFWKKVKGH